MSSNLIWKKSNRIFRKYIIGVRCRLKKTIFTRRDSYKFNWILFVLSSYSLELYFCSNTYMTVLMFEMLHENHALVNRSLLYFKWEVNRLSKYKDNKEHRRIKRTLVVKQTCTNNVLVCFFALTVYVPICSLYIDLWFDSTMSLKT